MKIRIGDIFWHTVIYRNGVSETRPVVIFDITSDGEILGAFATITGSEINDFDGKYDKWKVPLFRWKDAGLSKSSYIKANCYAYLPISVFENKPTSDYLGRMNPTDFANVIRRIEEFVESDEMPW